MPRRNTKHVTRPEELLLRLEESAPGASLRQQVQASVTNTALSTSPVRQVFLARWLTGYSPEALAARLGCAVDTALRLQLCGTPRGRPQGGAKERQRWQQDVRYLAQHLGLAADPLAALLQEVGAHG